MTVIPESPSFAPMPAARASSWATTCAGEAPASAKEVLADPSAPFKFLEKQVQLIWGQLVELQAREPGSRESDELLALLRRETGMREQALELERSRRARD